MRGMRSERAPAIAQAPGTPGGLRRAAAHRIPHGDRPAPHLAAAPHAGRAPHGGDVDRLLEDMLLAARGLPAGGAAAHGSARAPVRAGGGGGVSYRGSTTGGGSYGGGSYGGGYSGGSYGGRYGGGSSGGGRNGGGTSNPGGGGSARGGGSTGGRNTAGGNTGGTRGTGTTPSTPSSPSPGGSGRRRPIPDPPKPVEPAKPPERKSPAGSDTSTPRSAKKTVDLVVDVKPFVLPTKFSTSEARRTITDAVANVTGMSKSSYVVELRQGTRVLGATMAATASASGAGQAHSIQIKFSGISAANARDIDRAIATKLPSELKRQLGLSDMPIITTTTTAAGGKGSNNNKILYYVIGGVGGLALIGLCIYLACVSSSTRSSRDYDTDESDLDSEWEREAESRGEGEEVKPDLEATVAPILAPELPSPEAA